MLTGEGDVCTPAAGGPGIRSPLSFPTGSKTAGSVEEEGNEDVGVRRTDGARRWQPGALPETRLRTAGVEVAKFRED